MGNIIAAIRAGKKVEEKEEGAVVSAEGAVVLTSDQKEAIKNIKKDCLAAHNEYRAKHADTPDMVWSEKLASGAQAWAAQLAKDGVMSHSPQKDREGQGENVACCNGQPMTGRFATEMWYGEIKDFDFGNKVFAANTGHFTQVVWKESTQVGAAISCAPGGWNFCVARYSVGGNMQGAFDANIGDLKE